MIYHLAQSSVNSLSTTACNPYHLRSTQGNVSPLHHFDSSQQSTVSMSPPSSRLFNIHITGDTLTVGAILDLQVLNCALFLAHFQSVAMPNPVLSLFNLCPASVRDGFGFASFPFSTAQAARATQAYFTPTPCSGISHPPRGSISLTSYGHFFLARLSHSSEAG